jgi:hypothetical protein
MNLKQKLEESSNVTRLKGLASEAFQSELMGLLRGENDSAVMLDFQFKTGRSRTLCYVDLREMEFDASEGLMLYFSSLRHRLLRVTIIGRNLQLVHEMLKLQRVQFLREYPADADDLSEEDIFIEEMLFEEVTAD